MKHKIFLVPVCGLIFFLLGFSNDLNVQHFPNASLAGKYHYEYDHCQDPKVKNKADCKCAWGQSWPEEKLLVLDQNGTFVLEQLKPQGGFEVLPVNGKWERAEDGVLILSGRQFEGTDYAYYFLKTFSIFNGNLIEKNSLAKAPWIKQN